MTMTDTRPAPAPVETPTERARRMVESVLRKASGHAIVSVPPQLSGPSGGAGGRAECVRRRAASGKRQDRAGHRQCVGA